MGNQRANSSYEIIPVHEATRVRFYTSFDSGSYVPPHWHDALEIVYLLEGELTFTIENDIVPVQPGRCVLVNPNVVHATQCLSPNRAIVFQIPLSFVEACLPDVRQMLCIFMDPDPDPVKQTQVEKLKDLLLRMKVLDDARPDGGFLDFNSLLFEAMSLIYKYFTIHKYNSKIDRRGHDLSQLNPVLTFTAQHYDRPIPISEIAGIAGLQPHYFCRFFKKCMGVTFLEYQNELRLSYIYRDLLHSESNGNISAILERHGFTNYKVFRRMFFNRFQATPSQIRKQFEPKKHDILSEKIVL